MRLTVWIVTACVFASSVGVSAQNTARPTLTNDDVIQMVTASLSESLILSQIRDSRTAFDLSTAEVIRLSTAGVSETLIAAMRVPSVSTDTAPAPPVVAPPVQAPPAVAVPVSQAPRSAVGTPPMATPPASAVPGSMAEGQRDAELSAETTHTGGKVAVGVVVGALTGLIGTTIGYFVIGPQTLSAEAALERENKTPEYQKGYQTGWAKRTKDKKRKAFLIGGLLGTAAFLATLISISQQQDCGYIGTTYVCY